MKEWSLTSLLQPVSWERFIEEYWQQQPLYIQRDDPNFYRELVDTATVEYLIATHGGKRDFPISVIGGFRNAQPKQKQSYGNSHWTAERVGERFVNGATIRIGNTPEYVAAIKRLAVHFEAQLNTDISINLYLTPPGSQAFDQHFDNHDVFIVQIEGEKTWRLFAPPEDLPLEVIHRGRTNWIREPLPYATSQVTRPPTHSQWEVHLQPGDMLYVPRGHVHQVFTEGQRSLHLTVAAPVVTWYEVLVHALLSASNKSRTLREALPAGFAINPSAMDQAVSYTNKVIEALQQSITAKDLRNSLDELSQQFVYSRKADWQGMTNDLIRVSTITTDTQLQIRSTLVYNSHKEGVQIFLLFSERSLILPIRVESMLNYILQHKVFRVGDLPSQLSDESRLVLARTLVLKGFLSFSGPL